MTQQLTLRDARRRKNPVVTQAVLAKRSGIDQTYISLIELGRRHPSDDVRKRLAKALGIAPSRLRFSDPEPTSKVTDRRDKAGQSSHATLERVAS